MSFALVWAEMYRHHNTIPNGFFEDQMFVGDGMAALGFEMIVGSQSPQSFLMLAFPQKILTFEMTYLEKIDLKTLGNAVFSQWRYFNHWGHPSCEADYEWFVMAFTRMAELVE